MKKTVFLYALLAVLAVVFFTGLIIGDAQTSPKRAYITFDDGPTLNTPKIIKILKDNDACATFFVLKDRIELYPNFIKEIVNSGNAVGLHGVSHSEAIYSSDTSAAEEMNACNDALYKVSGQKSRLVRVPYGSSYRLTGAQYDNLRNYGYILWDWNVDPRDSVGHIDKEKVLGNLKKGIKGKDSAVILLHDRKTTRELLPSIVRILKDNGYSFCTLDDKMEPIIQMKEKSS